MFLYVSIFYLCEYSRCPIGQHRKSTSGKSRHRRYKIPAKIQYFRFFIQKDTILTILQGDIFNG